MIGKREPGQRTGTRRGAPAEPRARCSCELLISLSAVESVRATLTSQGLDVGSIRHAVAELHEEVEPEPADWRVRISQRGAGRGVDPDLDLLLALVRSADCHAYQLLERLGVACGALRKRLIDQLRALEARRLGPRELATPGPEDSGERPLRLAAGEARSLPQGTASAEPARAARGPATDRPRRLSAARGGAPQSHDHTAMSEGSGARPGLRRLSAAGPAERVAPGPADPARPRQAAGPAPGRRSVPVLADIADASAPRRVSGHVSQDMSDPPAARRPDAAPRRVSGHVSPDMSAPPAARRSSGYVPSDISEETDADPRRAPEPPARPAAAPAPARAPAPRPDADARRLAPIDPRTLGPLHGREGELARLADAVLRRSPRPPLLVGPPGSGRTLLARHLAAILHQPVFYLSATRYEDEDALRSDLAAVARQGGVAILDDLDHLGADGPPAQLGALAKAWSSGQPPIVALTSPEGHQRLAAWAPGLAAALDLVALQPLEGEDLRAAVAAAAPAVLAQHGLSLGPGSRLGELVRLADRFLVGLAQPGRSLDLLDLACARSAREGRAAVGRDTWVEIVCERSGIPRERIEGTGHQDMLDLEAELARTVVGHEPALATISQLIRRNRAGFGSQRPIATVLLLGPSGVGKTEIAKALCAALFDRPDAFVRLDMSEYAEAHAVARIVGAPPGYVGHEQGGALTDPLRAQPHCVVLLDEIEKAHRDVHQLLLQVLDEGRLTDGRGRTIDFRHAAILMTSNLGAACRSADDDLRLDEARVLEAARAAFPVELWNRIEAPLVLHPLRGDQLARICARLVKTSSDRLLRERGIRYRLTDAATRHVVDQCGKDLTLGARPLRHVLTRSVEATLADAILRGQVRAGMHVDVDVARGDLVLLATRGP